MDELISVTPAGEDDEDADDATESSSVKTPALA